MKISCLLLSYNRPTLLLQALDSVAKQSCRDFELIVLDESNVFDAREALKKFDFPAVRFSHWDLTPEERRTTNRLSVKINAGLDQAAGDIICYLCDDDFYHPDWFANGIDFLRKNPGTKAVYGKLIFAHQMSSDWPTPAPVGYRQHGYVMFANRELSKPPMPIDHSQVLHARVDDLRWPEARSTMHHPDAIFYEALAKRHVIHPVDAWAVAKRVHEKNLQTTINDTLKGNRDTVRE